MPASMIQLRRGARTSVARGSTRYSARRLTGRTALSLGVDGEREAGRKMLALKRAVRRNRMEGRYVDSVREATAWLSYPFSVSVTSFIDRSFREPPCTVPL